MFEKLDKLRAEVERRKKKIEEDKLKLKQAEENLEKAVELMRGVQRGDYFQMTADYSHGQGAHSAIMIADWDPETDTVRWMDSNMAGKKVNGVRYGMVQFNAEESAEWWAKAFCVKKRGATIYRLRDDIIFKDSISGQ